MDRRLQGALPLLGVDEILCERCELRTCPYVTVCRGFCGRRVCAHCYEVPTEGSPCCLDCLRNGIWVPGRGLCSPAETTPTILDQTVGVESPDPDMDCDAGETPKKDGAAGDERGAHASGWVDYRGGTAGGRGDRRRGPWPTNLFLPDGWICSVCGTWVSSWPQSTERTHWCVHYLGYPTPSGIAKYVVTYPDSEGDVFILLCDYCAPLPDDDAVEQQRGHFCCRRRAAVELKKESSIAKER